MKRIELPLYLKISPIYNKILQLTIAVVLIVIVLNIHFISDQKSQTKVHQHYQTVGQLQLTQLSDSASVYLQKNDRKSLIALAENVTGVFELRPRQFGELCHVPLLLLLLFRSLSVARCRCGNLVRPKFRCGPRSAGLHRSSSRGIPVDRYIFEKWYSL